MSYSHPSHEELVEIFRSISTVAAVGASSDPIKAANRKPAYLATQGYRVIPVSPRDGELFGEPIRKSLAEIDEHVDVVNVFRPSAEAPGIAEEAVAIGANILWLQSGIVSQEAADIANAAGVKIVMDLCMGTTHARLMP